MKVTHVIGSCSPGGAELFTKSLLKELKRAGLDVDLWVMTRVRHIDPQNKRRIDFENQFVEELSDYKINTFFIGKRPKKDWRRTRTSLRDAYEREPSGVIHSHLESVSFHVCLAFWNKPVPLVQTVHSTKISHPFVGRFFMKRCFSRYVAISKKVSDIIQKTLRVEEEKVRVILNGVDLSLFRNDHTKIIAEQVTKFIAIGSLTEAKDYPNLLDAFSILKGMLDSRNMAVPELKIVGDGELKPQIEKKIHDLGLNYHIQLLGLRKDIPQLLADSDIYVMASEWEGLSISLIEALAAGMPIVVTDAGSNDEIIRNEESGIMVPCKNPRALAEAIFRVMNEKKTREAFSMNARIRAESFSIQRCAEKHIETYKELLGKNRL